MKIAVFAKTGSIPQHRWVRLTGNMDPNGAFECELVGAGQRAHAIVLDHPSGAITSAVLGYADSIGAIRLAEAGTGFAADVELRSNPDGTVSKAAKGDFTVGVSINAASKGAKVPIMIRWSIQS